MEGGKVTDCGKRAGREGGMGRGLHFPLKAHPLQTEEELTLNHRGAHCSSGDKAESRCSWVNA